MTHNSFYFQERYKCFCGNSFGKHGQAPYTDCDGACHGDTLGWCGGTERNAVYDVGSVELPCTTGMPLLL